MIREKKEQIINELTENLKKSAVAIATDYRGMTAKEMVQLRKTLYNQGVDYLVVKNTFARFAAEKAGIKEMDQFFSGPLAIAIGYDDPVKAAKMLNEHIKASNSVLKIKGGVLSGKVMTAAEVVSLASIPPREVLIAQLLGRMQAPISSLQYVLSAPVRGMMGILQARIKQLEGGSN